MTFLEASHIILVLLRVSSQFRCAQSHPSCNGVLRWHLAFCGAVMSEDKASFYANPDIEIATPSAVLCRTVSEHGSSSTGPASVEGTPNFPRESVISVPYDRQGFSPALSDLTIVHSISKFTGQSPAPFYQPSPSLTQDYIPFCNASREYEDIPHTSDRRDSIVEPTQYRYRHREEENLRDDVCSMQMLHGLSHPDTLRMLVKLGEVLIDQGRYRSAEEMIREAVNAYKDKEDKNNNKDMLDALGFLGQVLHLQGFYPEAEKVQRRVFECRKKLLGPDDRSTLSSIISVATTLADQGKFDEAATLQREVLAKRKHIFGEDDPDTIAAMDDVAAALVSLGEYERSLTMSREVLAKRRRILGDDHPDTITAISNVAMGLASQGEHKTALRSDRALLATNILIQSQPYLALLL